MTGLVCMTTTTANACPSGPPAFGPFTIGTRFGIGVFIQGSDALAGFDIYVKSDPAVLTPTGASLGPLIVNPSLTSTCVNGIAQTGSCTVNTANGNGVVEVTTIEGSGGNECGGISPCSGMAFFINYTVVGSTASTPLSYPAAAGCSASSVSSPPNVCVAVADNVGTFLTENIQDATVIQTSSPDFTMAANPSSLSVNAGSFVVSNITLVSVNGLQGLVVFQTTIPPGCPFCPTWNVNPATVQLRAGGTNSSRLAFFTNSSTPAGGWVVNVTGTVGTVSHIVTVFTVISSGPPHDFTIAAIPSSLIMSAGINASSTITLTSVNGFSGVVLLSTNSPLCPQPQCTTWLVTPTQVSLGAGGSANAFLVINAANRADSGTISVRATSGGLVHQTAVAFQVQASSTDFTLNAFQSFFTIPAGTTASSQIQINPNIFSTGNSFSVTLSAAVSPPNGLAVDLNPGIVTLSSFTVFSTLTISTLATTPAGNYTISVTGMSSGFIHSVIVSVQVLTPPTLKVTPTSGTVGAKVLVQGSGFPVQFGQSEIIVSFDDQLVGFTFTSTTSFNFTFNVPVAQAGPHTVKAFEPFFFNGSGTIMATAPFQVISSPTGFTVTLDVGTLYFPGDKATAFILVAQNGQPVSPMSLQLTLQLIKPDGTIQILVATKLTTGVYSAVYTIPTTGTAILGTYAITVTAHSSSLGDSAALGSFEVKPTWLSKNAGTITTGTAIAGIVGFGAVGLAWKKGYLKKKDDEQTLQF